MEPETRNYYITWILARAVDDSTARCSNSTSLSMAAYSKKQILLECKQDKNKKVNKTMSQNWTILVALCAARSSSALLSAEASSSRRA